jgi:Casein kinase II regulatory subunit
LLLHQRYVLSPRGLDMVRRRFLLKASGPSNSSSAGSSSNSSQEQSGQNNNSDDVDPIFGRCPTLACRGMPLLPIGDSDNYHSLTPSSSSSSLGKSREETAVAAADHRAKRYCASCRQVYYHWDSKVDGCAWGTFFCHLFLMVCGKEVFQGWDWQSNRLWRQDRTPHVARIFGFKLHPSTQQ